MADAEYERQPRRAKTLSVGLLTYLRRVERLIADDAFSSDEGARRACRPEQASSRGLACRRSVATVRGSVSTTSRLVVHGSHPARRGAEAT